MKPAAALPDPRREAVTGRRVAVYLLVLTALAAAFPGLRDSGGWSDPSLHVVFEALTTLLALFLGVLALVRFYSRKNNLFLFLGTGFLGTALLDGYHAAVTAPGYLMRLEGEPGDVAAWSWIAARTLLAVFFCLNWLGWRRERRLGQDGRVGERAVYLTTTILTLATVLALAVLPVPPTLHRTAVIPRPHELVPASLFLLALVGYLWKGHWRDNSFDHWLVVSLLVGLVGEGLYMAFSIRPHDGLYDAAHVLKLAGYVAVLIGLLISVYSTFRQAETSAEALAHEVLQRERAQRELEVQKAYLEKLFESAPEAIIVLDETGGIARMNDEFTRMFGWRRDEALGRRVADLIVPEDRRSEDRAWLERVIQGHTIGYETVRARRDGTRIDVSILSTAIDLEPTRTAIYEIYRDITARKRADEELRQAKEAAEKATRAKSEFLTRMSHELRTPLNSVIGFASVVLRRGTGLSGEERTFLERIRDNGLHLLSLINDILDLSKVEAGKMTLVSEPVDVAELIGEVLEEFRGQVLDRELELAADLPRGLSPLTTDRGKLKQILINLVGNACKFTERGTVSVRIVADGAGDPRAIEVHDTGIGIPPDRMREIFESFEQVESGTARPFGGSGLGLAISRALCDLLGFDLAADSEPGKGSVFTIALSPSGSPGDPDRPAAAGRIPVGPDGGQADRP